MPNSEERKVFSFSAEIVASERGVRVKITEFSEGVEASNEILLQPYMLSDAPAQVRRMVVDDLYRELTDWHHRKPREWSKMPMIEAPSSWMKRLEP
jgi:hypothetical protein